MNRGVADGGALREHGRRHCSVVGESARLDCTGADPADKDLLLATTVHQQLGGNGFFGPSLAFVGPLRRAESPAPAPTVGRYAPSARTPGQLWGRITASRWNTTVLDAHRAIRAERSARAKLASQRSVCLAVGYLPAVLHASKTHQVSQAGAYLRLVGRTQASDEFLNQPVVNGE